MRRFAALASAIFAAAIAGSACGPARVALPAGPGTPRADALPLLESATAACRAVRTLTTELTLAGKTGQQKIHGHVVAGFAPGALRLEGVAPFGAPAFILAAENGRGTLLLARDRRVLPSAPPAEILQALVGVSLSPDDLLAVLTGCVKAMARPGAARAYGADWLAVDFAGGGTAYLNQKNGQWRVASGLLNGLEIDYGTTVNGLPQSVRLFSADSGQAPTVDLDVRLQSFTINAPLERDAFSVRVPPDTQPMTLDDLRSSGPLGQRN